LNSGDIFFDTCNTARCIASFLIPNAVLVIGDL